MIDDATIRTGSALHSRRRVLFLCAPVTLLFAFADALALQRFSPLVFGIRLSWAALLAAGAVAIGRVSEVTERRLMLIIAVASSLFFALITWLTGAFASPLFHWILAMPLVIAVVLQEFPLATAAAAVATLASGVAIVLASGQGAEMAIKWVVQAFGMSALAVYASVTYRRLRFREQGLRESAAVAMERARASEHAIESRDVFLLIAAHELKTPLTSVVLNTDRLLRQTRDLNAPHTAIKETSEALHRQVSGVVGLVERLLDVSRLSSERPLLERTPMDIAPVIERAIELYRPTAQKHQSTLTLVDARPAMVAVDRTALQQVILNLLSNAVKFGVGKPVEVTLAVDAATARISVRDHGAGIGKADQERIFQRFERAGASLNKGGLGLGLWISRRLVEDMGGRLSVESAPEQGATFTVELPVVPARPARETPGAVSPAS